jgi:hypothetical protein
MNSAFRVKVVFPEFIVSSSLFWRMNLSWWANSFIVEQEIKGENLARLIEVVKKAEIEPVTENDTEFKKEEIEDWNKYFVEKKKRFLRFLKRAKKNDWTIVCSV